MTVDVEYARRGDISIAFQAIGDGPVDIIFGAGLISHLDLMWADPYATAFLRRLASIGRLLLFDKPGTGLSDPVAGIPTVEQRADDFLAVLDAAGSRRAVVIGSSEAAPPAVLLAATHPERVEALITVSAAPPRFTLGDDFLPGAESRFEPLWAMLRHSTDHWGDGAMLQTLSPYARDNLLYRRLAPNVERACASPGMARVMINAMLDYDVTGAVDAVDVPTLVIHRTADVTPVEAARWTADAIGGAKMLELPGAEHICWFNGDDMLAGIEDFVGGSAPRGPVTRKLVTVLYTDIVESTARAVQMGDERWSTLLAVHHAEVRDRVERHDGRLIKTMGDGVLAIFDRPTLAVRCALAISRHAREEGLQVRAGVHAGECEVTEDDISGVAAHIGARIMALAGPAEVLVSATVRDLVFGSGVEFDARGEHELKGVPGMWSVHAVVSDRREDQRPASQATPEHAALTPSPVATMKAADRALVEVANRAPRLSRVTLRLLSRRPTAARG
ncbi:adenylate/guanylate cyclase domain-containing protein [Mycobacterium sp. URHB0044]|uniref:adenylate/guanylate cyclase domain-containing protein n=1 Tax=Mycobacterium sp. URHB0044 TaxID=1380386 RepID=UPI00056556F4|nr:adenylate/guanylate cyclase domain-containing protein [Mycobacterium sp. URHB0044]